MIRPIHGLLLVFLSTAGMAQCDHVFNIEQTGNCVIPGFDLIVNVSGGTPPYEFTWYAQGNPVGTGPSLPVWSLQGGASVTVQAIDALGCTQWSPEYWIMTGEAISATATVAPDPLDCSNNVITLNDVNIAGGCGDVLVTLNSPAEVIGTITGPTITLTGMPSGPNEFLLIPTGACAYCISSLIVNVPNTCGANTITGRVYVDADNSCSFTTGDQSVTGMFVEAMGPGPQTTSTGANGLYTAHVTNGQYSVGIPGLPPIWSITCPPNAGDAVAVPPNASGMDIGLGPVGIFNDLGVEITGMGPHRNGMNTQVSITCTNRGNTTLDGTAVLTFDASLSFVGSTPSASAQVGNTVEWSLPALPPFASSTLTATLSIPVSAMLGDVLVYTATIPADPSDDMATNDAASLERVITGSFDPNDKMVFPEGDLPHAEVLDGTRLDYVVRFQNTGNDVALNVRIEDEIDPLLDLATFEVVGASHAWEAMITGRSAVFRFDGIDLPDSSSDQLGSQGFVRYRIAPAAGVQVNDVITNTAEIFFDHNPPVVTNTVSTTVTDITTGMVPPERPMLRTWRTDASIVVRSTEPMFTIDLLDLSGRCISRIDANGRHGVDVPLERGARAPYLLVVRAPSGTRTVKSFP